MRFVLHPFALRFFFGGDMFYIMFMIFVFIYAYQCPTPSVRSGRNYRGKSQWGPSKTRIRVAQLKWTSYANVNNLILFMLIFNDDLTTTLQGLHIKILYNCRHISLKY